MYFDYKKTKKCDFHIGTCDLRGPLWINYFTVMKTPADAISNSSNFYLPFFEVYFTLVSSVNHQHHTSPLILSLFTQPPNTLLNMMAKVLI